MARSVSIGCQSVIVARGTGKGTMLPRTGIRLEFNRSKNEGDNQDRFSRDPPAIARRMPWPLSLS
jgi:hypothetical protein